MDLGMVRPFTRKDGHFRAPRCSTVGLRGTTEWASLYAEAGRDQARLPSSPHSLAGPCGRSLGLVLRPPRVGELRQPHSSRLGLSRRRRQGRRVPSTLTPQRIPVRFFLKSDRFPASLILRGCPRSFYRIQVRARRGRGRRLRTTCEDCITRPTPTTSFWRTRFARRCSTSDRRSLMEKRRLKSLQAAASQERRLRAASALRGARPLGLSPPSPSPSLFPVPQ